ncbi:MAG: DUF3343 domain-containing protein [Oscillospiraceae bacterium]|nr:DUF3343 domain-containing protein [Oscillospiraceae bacterium]
MNYAATFHTHLAALRSYKRLSAAGVSARQAPVPRSLSSSCGTCVLYQYHQPALDLLDGDLEAVYQMTTEGYQLIHQNEE